MAVVFRAEDLKLGRPVALKAFRPPVPDPIATSRFLQEIRTVATLSHPNILPLHDSGEVEGILYFVTPFVEGESLRTRLERGDLLPQADAARIAAAVARALDHAHRRGVVHRDVKPENILLQEGEPLLADFGIAFPFRPGQHHGDRITGSGFRVGTPAYMSPEQVAGGDVDGRSDIYALGVVLYEMLGGQAPFEGRTPEAVLAAHISEPPPPLDTLRPDLDPRLMEVVGRALAKDPAERWQAAGLFAAALDPGKGPRRHTTAWRWVTGLAAVALVAFLALRLRPDPAATAPPQAILLADFVGPPTDQGLPRTIRELVAVALAQSRVVAPLAPDQLTAVRRAAGLADSVALTLAVARELAERAGVGAVVTGEVLSGGTGFVLVVKAVRAADGADLVSVTSHAANAAGLVLATERLTADLRRGLGERRQDLAATRPLLDVATPSFAAFRKFADALERARVGDPVGSNVLLREAVALDTGFSAAWAQMALNFLDARQLDSAAAAVREALARPQRLTDARRYRLQADAAYALDADPAAAVRWYDLYLQEVPRSTGGRNNRALYLTMLGRWDEARPEFLRAAADDPRGPQAAPMMQLNALASAVALGRFDSATQEMRRLEGPFRAYAELLLAAAGDRWVEAERLAGAVLDDPTAPPWLRMQAVGTQASAFSALGRPDDADRALARAAAVEQGVASRWYTQARLLLALARGRPFPEARPDTTRGGMVITAFAAGWRGDRATADRIAAEISRTTGADRRRLGAGPSLVRAGQLSARGDWRGAAEALHEPAALGELDAFALDRPSSELLRWAEARAWLIAGDSAAAIRALGPLRTSARLPPNQVALRGLTVPYADPLLRSPN